MIWIAAGQAERDDLSSSIWKIDGIEGYVYPAASAQPSGTSRIVRAHNPSTLNWVIVPETDLALWQSYGFTAAAVLIGYAYLN